MARGFETDHKPLAGNASALRADEQALRNRIREVLPPGRVQDQAELLRQCDESNQRSWAITLRKRILTRFARDPNAGPILEPHELETVLRHLGALDAGRASYETSRPLQLQAPIDEWPRASG